MVILIFTYTHTYIYIYIYICIITHVYLFICSSVLKIAESAGQNQVIRIAILDCLNGRPNTHTHTHTHTPARARAKRPGSGSDTDYVDPSRLSRLYICPKALLPDLSSGWMSNMIIYPKLLWADQPHMHLKGRCRCAART